MKRHLLTYTLIALSLGACARQTPDSEISAAALKNVNTKGLFANRADMKLTGNEDEFGARRALPLPGTSGARGAYENYFGYDPLNYFYQLAYYVHQSQPDIVTYLRLSVGNNYQYAWDNYDSFYGQNYRSNCTRTEVVAWTNDGSYSPGVSASMLRGPADGVEYVREAKHQLRLRFTTYGGYQDANAIIAIKMDNVAQNAQRQFWVMGNTQPCNGGSPTNFGWVDLSTDVRTYNSMTYKSVPIGGSNQTVEIRSINFQ